MEKKNCNLILSVTSFLISQKTVKGRYIGENIRLINDIMETTKAQNLPGILTSLNFRKAFDSLEWPFIAKTLDYFNFESDIKRWVSTFYTKIESTVVNNGYTTNWFKPPKGVRQGFPLSPYLFILSAELLSNKIRQDSTVKGIKVFGNEIKLSQFADDTTLFNADLASLEKALKIVDDFGKLAGLEKTKAIWLGRWASNKNRPLSIKWFHGPVKILGIHFSYDDKGNNELNFNQKIRKLQTKLDMWSSRDLTLFGRTMILKSLGLSQLVYSASNLVVPPGTVDLVKTKSFTFLWRNKKDKIKRSGLYQDPDTGGIRMPDLNIMFKALKLAWVTRFMNSVKRKLCLYDLPIFYKTILDNFNELKSLYAYYQKQDIIFFNNNPLAGNRSF